MEHHERFIERVAEFREFVDGGGLHSGRIEVPDNQPVTLSSPQRVGENLVRNVVDAAVELLVAPPTVR
jgi:hypothetical protein